MGGGSADIQNGNHISYCMYNECTDSEMGELNRKQKNCAAYVSYETGLSVYMCAFED